MAEHGFGAARLFARDMGSDLVVTQLLHEVLALVSLVGTQGDPMLAGNFFHHRHRGLGLGAAVSRSHATLTARPLRFSINTCPA